MEQFPLHHAVKTADTNKRRKGWLIAIAVVIAFLFAYGVFALSGLGQSPTEPVGKDDRSGESSGSADVTYDSDSEEKKGSEESKTEEASGDGWFEKLFGAKKKQSKVQLASTNGSQGSVQVLNILSILKPSAGASFDLSTLELRLVSNPLPGSKLSANKRMVTAPTEGTYESSLNAEIRFTPDSGFTGRARGVEFVIEDTNGVIFNSVYTPTVSAPATPVGQPQPPIVCENPSLQSFKILDQTAAVDESEPYASTINLQKVYNRRGNINFSSADANTLIQVANEALWISNDGGDIWTNKSPSIGGKTYVSDVAVSEDGSRLLLQSYDADYNFVAYRSDDSAETWTQLNIPFELSRGWSVSEDGMTIAAIAYDPDSESYDQSIYVSTNAGSSWVQTHEFDSSEHGVQGVEVHANGSMIVVDDYSQVTYESQLLLSEDGGYTFTQMVASAAGSSELYDGFFATRDGQVQIGITQFNREDEISIDGGSSWNRLTVPGYIYVYGMTASQDGQSITGIGLSDTTYQSEAFISRDSGQTWQVIPSPAEGISFREIRQSDVPDQYTLIAEDDDSNVLIYHTTNGGTTWGTRSNVIMQMFDKNQIDLDTATSGVQRIINREQSEGWRAEYDPVTDEMTTTVTDVDLFDSLQNNVNFDYTLTQSGCSSPTAGVVSVRINRS